ncbi:MAG: hypothetical protein INR73_03310 [Williamsia sp.]|nr:hypothetical protein [Williamsia sp.]
MKATVLFFLCTWLAVPVAFTQPIPVEEAVPYNFVYPQLNNIANLAGLEPFYAKLLRLKKEGKGPVRIVHIGDSHLQADLLTGVVRNRMQACFGNAGRGLVFPYQLARSNAPPDILSSSNVSWQANRLAHPEIAIASGVAGFCIQTAAARPVINLSLKPTEDAAQLFTRVRIFTGPEQDTGLVLHADNNDTDYVLTRDTDSSLFLEAQLDQPASSISLYPSLTPFQFYGASFEKGDGGVLYHTIGVNGATYGQYNKALLFWQQLPALSADLYIISMGTNEAQKSHPDLATFKLELLAMVTKLKAASPDAAILLTSPADSYFGGRTLSNPMKLISKALADFCAEQSLPFWDLYTITGGYGSARSWAKGGLMSHDRIHYIKPGYELQGNLLFTALAKGYNLYQGRFNSPFELLEKLPGVNK